MSHLTTESISSRFDNLDTLSTAEKLHLMNENDKLIALAVESQLPAITRAVDAITKSIEQGGRLIYVGCGTSGRLGVLDASECPVTFGILPSQIVAIIAGGRDALTTSMEGVEDVAGDGVDELKKIELNNLDTVVGIASSGSTPFVLGAVEYANKLGCQTVGLTCNTGSKLAAIVNVAIEVVVGAEVIAGSTRMAAGTATKMVLNMLSTTTMLNTNRCYRNLMVGYCIPVCTHQVSFNARACDKLVRRAVRIIREIVPQLDDAKALAVLKDASYDCKLALVMAKLNVTKKNAVEQLQRENGNLRAVIG